MTQLNIILYALFLSLSTMAQENPWTPKTKAVDIWYMEDSLTTSQHPSNSDTISQIDINRYVSVNYKTAHVFGRSLLTCAGINIIGAPINFVKSKKESELATNVYEKFQVENPTATDETLLKVRKRIRGKRNKTRVGGSVVGSVISLHIIGFVAFFKNAL